jgi:hypothetical protein
MKISRDGLKDFTIVCLLIAVAVMIIKRFIG